MAWHFLKMPARSCSISLSVLHWSPPSGRQAMESPRLLKLGLQHAVHRASTLPQLLSEWSSS
eukprot:3948891-Pleurochrysis_carterae.AAC.1